MSEMMAQLAALRQIAPLWYSCGARPDVAMPLLDPFTWVDRFRRRAARTWRTHGRHPLTSLRGLLGPAIGDARPPQDHQPKIPRDGGSTSDAPMAGGCHGT